MTDDARGNAIGVIFLVVWLLIGNGTPYGAAGFFLAALVMGIGWAAMRFFGMAVSRGGEAAWGLFCQLGLIAIFVIWLYPGPPLVVIFWMWVVGLPCVIAGMIARALTKRIAPPKWVLERIALTLIANGLIVFFLVSFSVTAAIVWTAAVAGAFVYGWLLGELSITGRHDARMGTSDEFEEAGYSRDR